MRKIISVLLCLVIGIGLITAQTTVVMGTVISSEDGLPIIGASVLVTGTTNGTITDIDGHFRLNVDNKIAKTLTISFVGMEDATQAIKPQMKIVLHSSTQDLDEVMVVAYGTAKKVSFTGSAQTVKGEKIAARNISNVTKALDGAAPGVQVTSGSGQPGAGSSVRIRGFGSLNAANTPLYVVDGVPYDGNINAINPNDIESMTIIKDASAGALYGSRAANGVIMITTKKGNNNGKQSVNLKANWGVASRAVPRYELLDAYGWMENTYMTYKNSFLSSGSSVSEAGKLAINDMLNGAEKLFGVNQEYNPFSVPVEDLIDYSTDRIKSGVGLKWNEDWLDEAMADNPLRQEYVVSMTGGNEKTKYMFSAGYLNQEGLVKSTFFERYTARTNIDSELNSWAKMGVNLNVGTSMMNSTTMGVESTSNSYYSNVFYSCQNMGPFYPFYLKDSDGNNLLDENGNMQYDWGDNRPSGANAGWNPVANLNENKVQNNNDNVSGRTYVELGNLKSGALKGLALKANFGFDYIGANMKTYYNPDHGDGASSNGFLNERKARTFSYTFNQLLTYNREFGKHSIDAMVGHEYYDYNYSYLRGTKTGQAMPGLISLDGFVTIDGMGGYEQDYRIDSYLSRLNYGYNNKYYLSGSFRRDGSSRFYRDNRWGNFWSVGGSWRLSEEEFMVDQSSWLTNLTLKASYGIQGNDNILDSDGYSNYYAWQQFYDLGYPNGALGGALASSLEVSDITWEKNANFNIGIEASFFNRASLSIEWFQRKTTDMLMSYPMAVSSGFSSYYKNVGSMRNSGFDISLSGDIIKYNDFNWNMGLMASTVSNKVLKLTESGRPIIGSYTIVQEGDAINSFYVAKSAGVDPANGDQLYVTWTEDENGKRTYGVTNDYAEAQNYREVQGSRIPKVYGSWSNSFRYKGFDLNVMTTYSIGGKIYDSVYNGLLYISYMGSSGHVDRDKAWKKPGDITNIPRLDARGAFSHAITDQDLVSASYFAIKNITFGYTLPSKLTKAIDLKAVRFSFTADNLLLLSARTGLDPQYNFTGTTGYTYTPERTISFGVDVTF